ncbi:MAG TPA: MerR family transcriptional regulator [Burkholderiaceae bacterium]|nr:MerR family transcriptional regulator [Burkholderiaceae bacterium]
MKALPAIPAKRYFTIGEVSELCGVKSYVLRYWEQEFTQLRPMKRRGNRRYYQHHEVLLIRRIRELLYDQGFTISGARNQLVEAGILHPQRPLDDDEAVDTAFDGGVADAVADELADGLANEACNSPGSSSGSHQAAVGATTQPTHAVLSRASTAIGLPSLRDELIAIRALLVG